MKGRQWSSHFIKVFAAVSGFSVVLLVFRLGFIISFLLRFSADNLLQNIFWHLFICVLHFDSFLSSTCSTSLYFSCALESHKYSPARKAEEVFKCSQRCVCVIKANFVAQENKFLDVRQMEGNYKNVLTSIAYLLYCKFYCIAEMQFQ